MNPTFMTLNSANGMLQTGAPSLDRYDDAMLADLGIDRNGNPVDGRTFPVSRQRGSVSQFFDWLVAPFRSPAAQSVNL